MKARGCTSERHWHPPSCVFFFHGRLLAGSRTAAAVAAATSSFPVRCFCCPLHRLLFTSPLSFLMIIEHVNRYDYEYKNYKDSGDSSGNDGHRWRAWQRIWRVTLISKIHVRSPDSRILSRGCIRRGPAPSINIKDLDVGQHCQSGRNACRFS